MVENGSVKETGTIPTLKMVFGSKLLLFVAFVAAVTIIMSVLVLTPYRPMYIHGYEIHPTEICPQEGIDVTVDMEVYDQARTMRVESSWHEVNTDAVAPGGVIPAIPAPPPGPRDTVAADVVRLSPDKPGEWTLETNILVRGVQFGLPNVQMLDASSTNSVHVLDFTDTQCQEGRNVT